MFQKQTNIAPQQNNTALKLTGFSKKLTIKLDITTRNRQITYQLINLLLSGI